MATETDGEILARLGTDGVAWAAELARALGNAGEGDPTGLLDPTPGALLHVWLCNAIEAGRGAGYRAGRTDAARAVTSHAYAHDRPVAHSGCAAAALGPYRHTLPVAVPADPAGSAPVPADVAASAVPADPAGKDELGRIADALEAIGAVLEDRRPV